MFHISLSQAFIRTPLSVSRCADTRPAIDERDLDVALDVHIVQLLDQLVPVSGQSASPLAERKARRSQGCMSARCSPATNCRRAFGMCLQIRSERYDCGSMPGPLAYI